MDFTNAVELRNEFQKLRKETDDKLRDIANKLGLKEKDVNEIYYSDLGVIKMKVPRTSNYYNNYMSIESKKCKHYL
jgi:hypothetical protein